MQLPPELVALLANPLSYTPPAAEVRQVQTHISHVFLAGPHAYKFKKPVRFDFLDYSTPALRRQACEDEVRLNRRLAPDVYLGVIAITRDPAGSLALGGAGEPVEWGVKMRRLCEDDTLLAAITAGRLGPHPINRERLAGVVQVVAAFYRSLPPALSSGEKYLAELERHVRGNFSEIAREEACLPAPIARRIHAAQLLFLHRAQGLLSARVEQGRVIDGHGDLRPEHIYLTDPPAIVDCIEFSAEFRRLDVLDELCFLESECTLLGAAAVGRALRDRCLQAVGDSPDERLADFYLSYRACVRGKIALLRARQLAGEAAAAQRALAQRYLELAAAWERPLGPPWLIVVRGLSGSGKSTLARALAEKLLLSRLSTDDLRRQLPAVPPEQRYSPEQRGRVYDELFAQAAALLAAGESVILDGTFLSATARRRALALSRAHGAEFLHLRCEAPLDLARQRIARRLAQGGDPSEAQPQLPTQQAAWEEADGGDTPPALAIEMSGDLSTALAQALAAIPPLR